MHQPLRTCAATNQKLPQSQLLRFVNIEGIPTPEILIGQNGKLIRAPGRGVYIQPTESAYQAAVKRKVFAHRLKTSKPPVAWAEIAPHLPSAVL